MHWRLDWRSLGLLVAGALTGCTSQSATHDHTDADAIDSESVLDADEGSVEREDAGRDGVDTAPQDAENDPDRDEDSSPVDVQRDALPSDGGNPTDAFDGDATADAGDADAGDAAAWVAAWRPEWGVHITDGGARIAVPSNNATRIEAWFYDRPIGGYPIAAVNLTRGDDGVWVGEVALPPIQVWYGLRAWGPNWPWDASWEPGSTAGFVADVDAAGNRFNPNKLLIDPWALELSHDPGTAANTSWSVYRSGDDHRAEDSGPRAPRGLLSAPAQPAERPPRPTRSLARDVIYEVHVRNFTRNADDLPVELRGTYAGAATRAEYLAALGVTAIEFLPLHETQNEQNDLEEGTSGDNLWGYSTLSFFAPERRYAADRSPGGPTRELIAMVDTFHAAGIKVFVDVVYNHTAEGGAWGDAREQANVLSWRGLDNIAFYQTYEGSRYRNDNGVGPNMRFTSGLTQRLVLDSLRYWYETIGVDGFRFDLAAVLGNTCEGNCYTFSPGGLLSLIPAELGPRPRAGGEGVDLIAEPWGTTAGTWRVGEFPAGWFEWNDRFRDIVRDQQNVGTAFHTPAAWIEHLDGTPAQFGRWEASAPVNYVAAHDGFTLADLYGCDGPNNTQPWPWGPSDGGSTWNRSWDQGGDEADQRAAARVGMALTALSRGAMMFNGGDELLRTQRCNNNTYNVDSDAMGLDWNLSTEADVHATFVRRLLAFRDAHPELSPTAPSGDGDRDGDGVGDLLLLGQRGEPATRAEAADASAAVVAWRVDLDGSGPGTIAVAWNRSGERVRFTLPVAHEGAAWMRVADTAPWNEPDANIVEPAAYYRMGGRDYDLNPRSLVVWIEQ